jgi:hypothetical protein
MEARLEDEDENGMVGEDDDAPLMMVSYCHRHCRVDVERAKGWVVEDDEPGNGFEPRRAAAVTSLETKRATELEGDGDDETPLKRRREELLERIRKRDDVLDQPEDSMGAARCRAYERYFLPLRGHPRTEAGEETIVADKTVLRRALQHGLVDSGFGARRSGSRGGSRHRREREAWVQCESCSKWRRVRQSVAEAFSRADAGQWTCADSEHPRIKTCDVPQELPDDDIDERVALGDECPFYDDDDLDPPEIIADSNRDE